MINHVTSIFIKVLTPRIQILSVSEADPKLVE